MRRASFSSAAIVSAGRFSMPKRELMRLAERRAVGAAAGPTRPLTLPLSHDSQPLAPWQRRPSVGQGRGCAGAPGAGAEQGYGLTILVLCTELSGQPAQAALELSGPHESNSPPNKRPTRSRMAR